MPFWLISVNTFKLFYYKQQPVERVDFLQSVFEISLFYVLIFQAALTPEVFREYFNELYINVHIKLYIITYTYYTYVYIY